MFGSGTTASALAAGGSPNLARTEEWVDNPTIIKTITTS